MKSSEKVFTYGSGSLVAMLRTFARYANLSPLSFPACCCHPFNVMMVVVLPDPFREVRRGILWRPNSRVTLLGLDQR